MNTSVEIIVASKNPVKINAVAEGFKSFFPEVKVIGVSLESGVSDQPMSDEETRRGALNRVTQAKLHSPSSDFWVGIEGGVERDADGLTAFAWVVIQNKEQNGEARTTTFRLPKKVSDLIDEGYELGHANDIVFSEHNSKQNSGAVGLLTKDILTRTQLYKQAVQLALIPIINRELYLSIDR